MTQKLLKNTLKNSFQKSFLTTEIMHIINYLGFKSSEKFKTLHNISYLYEVSITYIELCTYNVWMHGPQKKKLIWNPDINKS